MTLVLARNRASSLAAVLLGLVIGSGSFAAAQDQGGPRRPGGRNAPAPQQPPPDAPPSAPPERPAVPQAHAVPDGVMQVYPLKHVSADSLATIIPTVLSQSRIAVDEHTNAIVLLASAADHEKAAALIAKLDVESAAPRGLATHILQSPTNIDDDLRGLVQAAVSRQARVAHRGKLIVVTGTPADAEAVQRVLNEAASSDAAAADHRQMPSQIEFYFLSTRVGAAAPDPATIPAALQPVAQALAESGFGAAKLFAPFKVNLSGSGSGETFSVSGLARGEGEPLKIELEGRRQGRSAVDPRTRQRTFQFDGTLHLELSASVRAVSASQDPSAPSPAAAERFRLRTIIQVQPGAYMVVAASPASTDTDEAIALVVRVTEAK